MTNTLGNPLDSTVAAVGLIHSGLVDRLPRLCVPLVHGGGFLPQIGRLDRAFDQRDDPRKSIAARSSTYLHRFRIDSITYNDRALRFPHGIIGDERLVMGTNLPFVMGDRNPVGRLERVGLDPHVLGAAALEAHGGDRIP